MPSIALVRFFMIFIPLPPVAVCSMRRICAGQSFSDLAVQHTQAANLFHSLGQVLHNIVLHGSYLHIWDAWWSRRWISIYILAADAAKVHQIVVAGLGHVDRDLPCRIFGHINPSVSYGVCAYLFIEYFLQGLAAASPWGVGIIAPVFWGRKCNNWLWCGKYWLSWTKFE